MRRCYNVVTILFLLLTLYTSYAIAGTTGKISGKITDGKTGEAIVGASVVIVGANIGAPTDIDGAYSIISVSPGTYKISISSIGYRRQIVENVQVNSDFTTRIDAALSSESVDLEPVIVTAQRPLVRADLTSTRTTVDASQMRALPIEDIADVLRTQAGITEGSDGTLHFRGGRGDEVAYTVNGVSLNDPFTNTRSINIATNAIQELSVDQGTFNAEYGDALSGVVETDLKEGGENYGGQITYSTGDRVSTHDGIFYNIRAIDPVSHQIGEASFSGPVPLTGNALTFFVSGRWDVDRGYLFGVREHQVSDSPNFLNDSLWVIPMTGNRANVAMNPSNDLSIANRFSYKLSETRKLSYNYIFNQSNNRYYSHTYKYNPDALYNYYHNAGLHTVQYTDWLGSKTSFKVVGSYSRDDYEHYRYKDLDSVHYMPDEYQTVPSGPSFSYGGSLNGRFEQTAEIYDLKMDLVSQLSNSQELKGGIEGKFPQMHQFSATVLRDTVTILEPQYPDPGDSRINSYARFPKQYAAYLQDKLEFRSIVMNIGLRYDYFLANAKYPVNIFYPHGTLADASAKETWAPRVGVSYPITDRGMIHFSYAHLNQMPELQQLYANPSFKYSPDVTATVFGNANLSPQKTVTYEFGLQQQLGEDLAMDITGFYKDVRDLFASQTIRISGDTTFGMYVNKDYGNIKGVTVSLIKRRTASDLVSLSLDYTFQMAQGNDVSSDAFFIDKSSGRESEKVVVYLAWDQPHNVTGTFNVGRPKDWNVSLIGKAGAGQPYTPSVSYAGIIVRSNSGRKPMTTNVDLLADKEFMVSDISFVLFLKVYNLFDTLNELDVYSDTGRAAYTLAPMRGEGANTDARVGVIPGVHGTSDYYANPSNYSAPREVRVGLTMNF